jgi:hypothetical protein
MVKKLLSITMFVSVSCFSALSFSEESDEHEEVQTEIILTDFELEKPTKTQGALDKISIYGPYEIKSLPSDVQEKIIQGFDEAGQLKAVSMVKQQIKKTTYEEKSDPKFNLSFQPSKSEVEQVVQAVRENKIGGWNVSVKRQKGGALLYFKKKF